MLASMLEENVSVACPYCGEPVELLIDVSAGSQAYVEDCSVCCQPMDVSIQVDSDGNVDVHVERSDD